MRPPVLLDLSPTRTVPFAGQTMGQWLTDILEEIRDLYRADQVPWVVGYSGGKDSTLCLMLVWMALASLPPAERTKVVHVISTDTGVENPVVAAWVNASLDSMRRAAAEQGLPIEAHRLTPAVEDSFWVCLIGRGYAAPRPKFRWCTERLKIEPSNAFIRAVVAAFGEVILVLGTRKAESRARARTMTRHEKRRVRDRLSPNGSLPNSLVYSPIEDLSNDEVWELLMQHPNPWGHSNKDLLTMYQGASPDAECPLVVDSTTPSCGDSRFGCWTCTLVSEDKSMQAMISNDAEKEWMLPLLELRNALDVDDDRELRDFRRMSGRLHPFKGRLVHGAYLQQAREEWLRRLLEAQTWIRENGPQYVRDLTLITLEELRAIRHEWVYVKHEIEDSLPGIYQSATGEPYPDPPVDSALGVNGAEMVDTLREVCGDDEQQFLMIRELLGVERAFRTMTRRAGLFDALEKVVSKYAFEDEEDALDFALRREQHTAELRDLPRSGARAAGEPQPSPPPEERSPTEAETLAADLRAAGLVPADTSSDGP
ncbi:DNA phosphorothioation system sulfurtransferase DndC [Streptomyces sp. NPDC048219]|uniref:DNA phosphorothioation system sulfurtransferase DndC n=1 Tax=Streptomyces sp. NPDC048219 TaxID=3365517 RepID=UPI003714B338